MHGLWNNSSWPPQLRNYVQVCTSATIGLIDAFAKQFSLVLRRVRDYQRPTHFYSGGQIAGSDERLFGDGDNMRQTIVS